TTTAKRFNMTALALTTDHRLPSQRMLGPDASEVGSTAIRVRRRSCVQYSTGPPDTTTSGTAQARQPAAVTPAASARTLQRIVQTPNSQTSPRSGSAVGRSPPVKAVVSPSQSALQRSGRV